MPQSGSPTPLSYSDQERVEKIAYWLDERFRIPGTPFRIGLDGIAGLIPGLGDAAAAAVALYIVAEAHRAGLPRRAIARMLANVGVDFLLGSVPIIGNIFDIAFKANRRNLRILREHFETAPDELRTRSR